MALTSLDERDLLLPLTEGVRESPLWQTFLTRLRQRTEASQVSLMVRVNPVAHLPPTTRTASARPDMAEPDFDRLSSLGLIPYAALRPGRVYALEEMLDFEEPDRPGAQRAALREAGIAHARFIRIESRQGNDAWIVLLSDRQPFDADDSALLSALAPHMAVALDTLAEMGAARLRASIAEQALHLLGIGQMALDREGRVILTDDLAQKVLGANPGGRLNLTAAKADELAQGCRTMANAPAAARQLVSLDPHDLLLRPLPAPMGAEAIAVAAIRLPQGAARQSSNRITAELLGLSEREAALAQAMSRGASILDAGNQLQLTPETARNYTKRAYAKTGANGQADLVRMVLTSLVALG